MANVNGLTQINNQEVILEEINEEQLEEVVGGAGAVDSVFNLLFNVVGSVRQFTLELGLVQPEE